MAMYSQVEESEASTGWSSPRMQKLHITLAFVVSRLSTVESAANRYP